MKIFPESKYFQWLSFVCFYCLIAQPRQAVILSLQQRISEYQTEYFYSEKYFPSLTSNCQINSFIHFKGNGLVVKDSVYKVPFSFVTTLEVHISEQQTFTKILNKSQLQMISLTWPQHQQSNKMGNIGREKLILRWGKIYALDHHHKRSKKPFILDI